MVTSDEIDRKIREVSEALPEEDKKIFRPFLCQGSPVDCEVFLIGHNPGVVTFFWDFWDKKKGCDREGLLNQYIHYNNRLGPTRRKIQILVEVLKPYNVLDTNIFHIYSKELSKLPKDRRDSSICDYLIANIKPKLIVVHGAEAIRHLSGLSKESLSRDTLTSVKLFGATTYVYSGCHLARHYSYARVEEIGKELKKFCGKHNLKRS